MFGEIVKYYLDYFHQHGELGVKTICNCVIPTKIFLEEYKKLEPVENLSEHDKKELKEYVIGLFPEKTVDEKVKAAKIIYTIGTLISV